MKFKKLSGALLASLMIHTAIVLLFGAYWVTKTPQADDSVSIELLSPISPPNPKQKRIIQVKIAIPSRGLAIVDAIGAPPAARKPSLPMRAVSNFQASSVLEFSSKAVRADSAMVYQGVPQLKPPNGAAYPDMYFKSSGVNPFLDTEDERLSTFAMDVDTAAYSMTRRYLTEGASAPRRRRCALKSLSTPSNTTTPPRLKAHSPSALKARHQNLPTASAPIC